MAVKPVVISNHQLLLSYHCLGNSEGLELPEVMQTVFSPILTRQGDNGLVVHYSLNISQEILRQDTLPELLQSVLLQPDHEGAQGAAADASASSDTTKVSLTNLSEIERTIMSLDPQDLLIDQLIETEFLSTDPQPAWHLCSVHWKDAINSCRPFFNNEHATSASVTSVTSSAAAASDTISDAEFAKNLAEEQKQQQDSEALAAKLQAEEDSKAPSGSDTAPLIDHAVGGSDGGYVPPPKPYTKERLVDTNPPGLMSLLEMLATGQDPQDDAALASFPDARPRRQGATPPQNTPTIPAQSAREHTLFYSSIACLTAAVYFISDGLQETPMLFSGKNYLHWVIAAAALLIACCLPLALAPKAPTRSGYMLVAGGG